MPEGDTVTKPKPKLTVVTNAPEQAPLLVRGEPGARPAQGEMPFAIVEGEAVTELPRDLYIPPHALEVFLEAFEGPLDLLLYLIRRQNLNILDIPIAEITRQYVEYIDLMHNMQLDLAGEYLLMAAMLAEIKSRMLLPRIEENEEDEDDPRAELVRRLLEYERFKNAADDIDTLPRLERDTFVASAEPMERRTVQKLPDLQLKELLIAFKDVLKRAETLAHHHIRGEALSVRQRMSEVLDKLNAREFVHFNQLFDPREGRMGVTVTFLALLELLKESLIELAQGEPYSPLHVRAASSSRASPRLVAAADDAAAQPQTVGPDAADSDSDTTPGAGGGTGV